MEGERYYVVIRAYTEAGTSSVLSDETSGVAVTSSGIERQ